MNNQFQPSEGAGNTSSKRNASSGGNSHTPKIGLGDFAHIKTSLFVHIKKGDNSFLQYNTHCV